MLCSNCGKDAQGRGWSLRGYYGINGYFCSPCYDKVSHNSYGEPENPGEYIMILLRQQGSPVKYHQGV